MCLTPEDTRCEPTNQDKYSPPRVVNSSRMEDDSAPNPAGDQPRQPKTDMPTPCYIGSGSTSLYLATCSQTYATRVEVSSPSIVVNTRPEDDRASTGDQLGQSSIDTLSPCHISTANTSFYPATCFQKDENRSEVFNPSCATKLPTPECQRDLLTGTQSCVPPKIVNASYAVTGIRRDIYIPLHTCQRCTGTDTLEDGNPQMKEYLNC